jgi:hypothetical protein
MLVPVRFSRSRLGKRGHIGSAKDGNSISLADNSARPFDRAGLSRQQDSARLIRRKGVDRQCLIS